MTDTQIREKFQAYERAGYVRFRAVPDCEPYDDSYLDTWGMPPEELNEQREHIRHRVNDEGVWGIVAEARNPNGGPFEQVYDCWGFVGSDWNDSGYDLEAQRSAIDFVEQYVVQSI